MPYSLQLYTLRDQMDADTDGTLRRVAEIGYRQVEPYRIVPDTEALGAALARHGLTAPTAHAPILGDQRDEIFTAAAQLGIGTVILPATPPEQWADPAGVQQIAAGLNEASRAAADHGLQVGYHNHWWEFTPMAGHTALDHLTEHLAQDVVLQIDTYWAAVAEVDPVALITRLGSRVRYLHLKDGPVTRDPADQVALGQGSMPVHAILAAAGNLDLGVVELDDHRGDMFDAVEQSLQYLRAGDR